ncbi:MAG: DUF1275 domain-containing protein [Candidatus Eremiobacteraeota bacterium]|nr:DUF1275 domain-containing protein [Candidatus Eremiobacteraeota bacterium]
MTEQAAFKQAHADAPMIPWALIALTVTTGMVDAISYLRLGHVFVANMTGNVVFLGFAVAGFRGIAALGSLIAVAAFLAGSLAGGAMIRHGQNNTHLLLHATVVKFLLGIAALALTLAGPVQVGTLSAYALTALLALAMGVQNAAVRKMAVPDFTTTVLTMTITGIAADYSSGIGSKLPRRATSVVSMFAGALLGAALALRNGIVAALIVIVILFGLTILLVAITRNRQQKSPAPP